MTALITREKNETAHLRRGRTNGRTEDKRTDAFSFFGGRTKKKKKDEMAHLRIIDNGSLTVFRRRTRHGAKTFTIGDFQKLGGDSALGGVSAKFAKISGVV